MSPHASPSTSGVLHRITAETRTLSGPSVTAEDAAAYGTMGAALRPGDVRSTGMPAPLLAHPYDNSTPGTPREHIIADNLWRGAGAEGTFGTPLSASGHLGAAGSTAWSAAWQPAEGGGSPSAGGSGSAGGSLSQQASAATGTSCSDDITAGHNLSGQASVARAAPVAGDNTEDGPLGSGTQPCSIPSAASAR